ncbi:MAG: reverse transcriptase/maturase family protein [Kiritimatiellia bacterium]|jgi:retron-type reverse transcriptase|nr:reverse transcriptase/maturase family protein [Planctomycetota bacterium]MDP6630775.1 reverse transcriptase/maturase family protein [Kiritimatiellia bacterium]MDP6809361.1 reverse transcriptase/maturase family protein [Kiritimatiellia bacterium]MDP7023961.1 reverse transcriptase/maturase family protein [Kiritimatiellia bacterium]
MKRAGNLYERIAEPENLRLAFIKSIRGKRGKADVIAYTKDIDENLRLLRDQLLSKQVDVGHYHFFTVHEPKERLICAASFPERVLHHAIMNICEPVLERYAIHDSYACRTGKGMHAAVLRAQTFTRRYDWYLKLDIGQYFASIDHNIAMALLGRRIKDRTVLQLIQTILKTYSVAPGCGFPIGNLLSQHLANFYLGHLDHWIKETLRVRGYVRYMDDFVLWADEKGTVKAHLEDIRPFLESELKLELKNNVQLNRCSRGIPFLGYRVFPRRLTLGPRARRRFARKLHGYEQEWMTGEWSQADLARHMEALLSYVRFADTLSLRKQIVEQFSVAA